MKRHYESDKQFDNGAYKVKGYDGVAWWILGFETKPDEDTEWTGYENRTGNVVGIMVGDDRHFVFGPDEITPINDDEFCHECGQIGCSHYID